MFCFGGFFGLFIFLLVFCGGLYRVFVVVVSAFWGGWLGFFGLFWFFWVFVWGFLMVDLTLVEEEHSESACQQLWRACPVQGGCLEVPSEHGIFFSHLQNPNSINVANLLMYLI